MADQQRTPQGELQRGAQGQGGQGQQGRSQQSPGFARQQGLARRDPFFDVFDQPFGLLRRFTNDLDRLFGVPAFGEQGLSSAGTWQPNVDVFRHEHELIVRADVPGMNKDDISVEITDDAVILQGEQRQEHEERRGDIYVQERRYGSFYRVIPLPEDVESNQARANFKNGTLEIVLPLSERARAKQPRRIEIAEGETQGTKEQREQPAAARAAGAAANR
jgi:HSP20 family protein